MAKSKSDPAGDQPAEVQPPTIPHLILLPEKFGTGRCGGDGKSVYQDAVSDAAFKLAARFQAAYVLTAASGLVQLAEFKGPSEVRLSEMHPERRHVLLALVGDQLRAALRPGQRIVCLVSGPELRQLHRLRLPLIVPLAGMSVLDRRRWLTCLADATDFVVGMSIFGGMDGRDPWAADAERRELAGSR